RFDFKGGKSDVTLDKTAKKITIVADDELKLRSIHQILEARLAKRGIDLMCLKYDKEQPASGSVLRQNVDLKSGLDKEAAKEVTKLIKESKLKVQAQVQDEQVRVTGKSIDELQEAIAKLKASQLEFPVQFINMRR